MGVIAADITFDAAGNLYGWSETSDDFVRIDKATGAATVVSNSGRSTLGDGMSVDRNGVLFAVLNGDADQLSTIDVATGQPTDVATLDGATGSAISAGSFACDRTTFYATRSRNQTTKDLVTINTASGAVTQIATSNVPRLDALEWVCPTEITLDASAVSVDESAGTSRSA